MPKKLRTPVTVEEKEALLECLGNMINASMPEASDALKTKEDKIEMFMRGGLLRRLDGSKFTLPETLEKGERGTKLIDRILSDGGCHLYEPDGIGGGSYKRIETDFTPGRDASFVAAPTSTYNDVTRAPKKPGLWSTFLKKAFHYRTDTQKTWDEYQLNKAQSEEFAYCAAKNGELKNPPSTQEAVNLIQQTTQQEQKRSEKLLMRPVLAMTKDVKELQNISAHKIETSVRSLAAFKAAAPDKQSEVCSWMAEILVRDTLLKDMFDHREHLTSEMKSTYTKKLFSPQTMYDASDLASTPAFREFVENMTEEQFASFTKVKIGGIFTHGDKAFEGLMSVMSKQSKVDKDGPSLQESAILSAEELQSQIASL